MVCTLRCCSSSTDDNAATPPPLSLVLCSASRRSTEGDACSTDHLLMNAVGGAGLDARCSATRCSLDVARCSLAAARCSLAVAFPLCQRSKEWNPRRPILELSKGM
ncbi:unnamed protein product [Linum trigynum]|uniref:Secreted protein n=1 Tax=Linum trigynum TaxID=586398 RepID=A0AAV2EWD4_9ROSI